MYNTIEPKFPDIEVKLVGEDGNAMSIIGRVRSALKKGDVDNQTIKEYVEEAMSSDYQNVLTTTLKYVSVK